MTYLMVTTEEGVRQVRLDRERLTIGRLASNDVVLPFRQISRVHAELRREGVTWWIADRGSTNGISVGSRRVARHALVVGEAVHLTPTIAVTLTEQDDADAGSVAVLATARMPAALAAAGRPTPPARVGSPPAAIAAVPPPSAPAARGPSPPQTTDPSPPVPPTAPFTADPPRVAWHPAARASAWAGRSPGASGPGQLWPAPADPARPAYGDAPADDPLEGDLFRRQRARASVPRGMEAAGPAPGAASPGGPVLHVCQTCGQLTAPDRLHCQSCHNTVAQPCRACGLMLLPVQERCPRCHTANPSAARRAGRRPGEA